MCWQCLWTEIFQEYSEYLWKCHCISFVWQQQVVCRYSLGKKAIAMRYVFLRFSIWEDFPIKISSIPLFWFLQLPFSTVGSLNGVHMFCKSQGAQLTSTYLEDDTIIVWKEFENCFTMIGIVKGYTEKIIRDLLDIIFNATIFSIGLNEVKHNKNPEQLKRELKVRTNLHLAPAQSQSQKKKQIIYHSSLHIPAKMLSNRW